MTETRYDLGSTADTWKYFWHPVCTLDELRDAKPGGKGPLQSTLLGERIAVAEVGGRTVAFQDRCPHRGVALSLGWVEEEKVRCRYHGWCYDATGAGVEVPSLEPGRPIPARARLVMYDCEVRYGLVWVRLDSSADTKIPEFPAWDDPQQRCILGEPYLWPISSGRRMENFIDVTHFPYTHQGTLGAPPNTVFPVYPVDQENGRLDWLTETFLAYNPGDDTYGPPAGPDSRMLPPAKYTVEMPFTVVLSFQWSETFATQIFMHATPIDAENCRSYWFTCHTEDGSSDQVHLQLQDMVLGEDLPVVASHLPRFIGDAQEEVSVFPDKTSILWRRWLRELAVAAEKGPEEIKRCLAQVNRESAAS
ncbi:aromatic ring-hydroxylating dioxygenase subunit alpha [Streptosporangium sp. NPDC051022]|uniref:aromatic ring-hydroxylating dioxygenase subunit alpha n=1 Tax=Streptosporangium sp. NPDC051022 TaxID=3155752 RepID=UPI0034163012